MPLDPIGRRERLGPPAGRAPPPVPQRATLPQLRLPTGRGNPREPVWGMPGAAPEIATLRRLLDGARRSRGGQT